MPNKSQTKSATGVSVAGSPLGKGKNKRGVRKIKPASPDRFYLKADLIRLRQNKLTQMIESFWPDGLDHRPRRWTKHYLEEFDRAILLINRRKKRYLARRPKATRGGQVRWDEVENRGLVVMFDYLREELKYKYTESVEWLSVGYGISYEKMKERLSNARRQIAKPRE